MAFTGDYDDLNGKPSSFPPASHKHSKSDITDFPSSLPASDVPAWAKAARKPSYNWDEIGSRPSAFPPASHTHALSQVTGLQEALSSKVNKAGDTCTGRITLSQGNYVAEVASADQTNNGVGTHWVKFARFTVTSTNIGHEHVVMEYKVGFRRSPLRLEFAFNHVGNLNPGSVDHVDFFDYAALYSNDWHSPAINCISENQHCYPGRVHLFLHHAGTSVYDLYVLKEIQWLSFMVSYLSMPHGVKVEWYGGAGEISAIPSSGVMFQIKCANADSPLFGLESRIAALEAKVK